MGVSHQFVIFAPLDTCTSSSKASIIERRGALVVDWPSLLWLAFLAMTVTFLSPRHVTGCARFAQRRSQCEGLRESESHHATRSGRAMSEVLIG